MARGKYLLTRKQRLAIKEKEKKSRRNFCKEYRENPYSAKDNNFDEVEEKFLKATPIRALVKLFTPNPNTGTKYKKKRKVSH